MTRCRLLLATILRVQQTTFSIAWNQRKLEGGRHLFWSFLSLVLATTCPAAEIPIERIFGAEHPGPYKHPASIAQLASGDFYIAYYGGAGEYATDTAVYGSRQKAGETVWSPPAPIADTPHRSEGNAVVWQAPDGTVWLYYVVRYGKTWSTSRIQAKLSRDGAKTWSDPITVAFDEGMMVRGRPLPLADGGHLLPVYHETGHDTEQLGPDSVSLFLRWDPKTLAWTESSRIGSRIGNIQPAVARVKGDFLVAYCRRGGGYGPTTDGYLVRSESKDDGRTWSPGVDSKFPNPNAAIDLLDLANGHLLLVYNHSMNDRTPLSVAVSTDGDKTWPHRRDIATGPGDFAYPFAIQAQDGKIHIVFTTDERTVIRRAVFDETAIVGRK